MIIFTKNVDAEGKTRHSKAVGEHNKEKQGNGWRKLKRAKLEDYVNVQKQPREVLFLKICFSFFNKVVSTQVFSCEHCETFKNTCFEEHLPTAAFECRLQEQ